MNVENIKLIKAYNLNTTTFSGICYNLRNERQNKLLYNVKCPPEDGLKRGGMPKNIFYFADMFGNKWAHV